MLSNRKRCEWYSWRAGAAQEAVNGHDRSSRRWRRKGRWDRQWPDAPRSLGPSRRPSGRATCPPHITPPQSTMVWDRSGGREARAYWAPPRPAFDFATVATATSNATTTALRPSKTTDATGHAQPSAVPDDCTTDNVRLARHVYRQKLKRNALATRRHFRKRFHTIFTAPPDENSHQTERSTAAA